MSKQPSDTTGKPALQAGDPYCGACGYNLSGCVDSAKCPECGRPLVEVLSRHGKFGKRYRSEVTLFGLPLIDIALGPVPGENQGNARGVLAIGDRAKGLIAIGGVSRGIVSLGGRATGVFAYGGFSLGIVSWGGLAIGGIVNGGCALGVLASGGMAAGWAAIGGMAAGMYAAGGAPFGVHRIGPGVNDAAAQDLFTTLSWYFGPFGMTGLNILWPTGFVIGAGLVASAVIGLMAFFAHVRHRKRAAPI